MNKQTGHIRADLRAFQVIVNLIRQGKVSPGERLFEPDLAERLDMSRTPLRAALSRLVAEGILEKTPGRKGYLLPQLSCTDRDHVFSLRAALEGLAAFQAAQVCTRREIEELRFINWSERELYQKDGNREGYASLNEEFHYSIVLMSGNPYIERTFHQLYWRSSLYPLLFAPFYAKNDKEQGDHVSWQEHAAVIDAIEARDARTAQKLVETHILNTERFRANRPQLTPRQEARH